jgi:hypothetical protein
MPEVIIGFSGSKGTPFLLQVMPARSRLSSAALPVSHVAAGVHEHGGEHPGVVHHGLGVGLETGPERLSESRRLAGDHMHQGPALQTRKGGGVDLLAQVQIVGQDHAAAAAAQSLVGRGGHHMGMGQRRRMHAGRDQPGEMGHVDLEVGAHLIGNLPEAREIQDPWVSRAAGDDQLRLVLPGQGLDLVEVDQGVVPAHAVLYRLEPLARQVGPRAVGQMAARGQRQTHDGIARLAQRQEHTLIGLGPGVRLHVGEFTVEQLLGTIQRQLLDHVDVFAATTTSTCSQPP